MKHVPRLLKWFGRESERAFCLLSLRGVVALCSWCSLRTCISLSLLRCLWHAIVLTSACGPLLQYLIYQEFFHKVDPEVAKELSLWCNLFGQQQYFSNHFHKYTVCENYLLLTSTNPWFIKYYISFKCLELGRRCVIRCVVRRGTTCSLYLTTYDCDGIPLKVNILFIVIS